VTPRGALCYSWCHRHTDARLRADTSPNMSQTAGRAADCRGPRSNLNFIPHHHTALGWGSRPLVFLARYLAGRPRGRYLALTCVAQTGVVLC